jgi:hypothetical protein
MKLENIESQLFFDLYHHLLLFVNEETHIFPKIFTVNGLREISSQQLKTLRQVLIDQNDFFDIFISKNPFKFSKHELQIIDSWKRWIVGRFFIFRETEYYTIFLSNIKPIKAYAVLALNRAFTKIFPEPLPIYIETALLPFQNIIVTDGIFSRFRLEFGGGFNQNLQRSYLEALDDEGIIHSL